MEVSPLPCPMPCDSLPKQLKNRKSRANVVKRGKNKNDAEGDDRGGVVETRGIEGVGNGNGNDQDPGKRNNSDYEEGLIARIAKRADSLLDNNCQVRLSVCVCVCVRVCVFVNFTPK